MAREKENRQIKNANEPYWMWKSGLFSHTSRALPSQTKRRTWHINAASFGVRESCEVDEMSVGRLHAIVERRTATRQSQMVPERDRNLRSHNDEQY